MTTTEEGTRTGKSENSEVIENEFRLAHCAIYFRITEGNQISGFMLLVKCPEKVMPGCMRCEVSSQCYSKILMLGCSSEEQKQILYM